jgi:riboflavin biosynthesis pyrimidine reductase
MKKNPAPEPSKVVERAISILTDEWEPRMPRRMLLHERSENPERFQMMHDDRDHEIVVIHQNESRRKKRLTQNKDGVIVLIVKTNQRPSHIRQKFLEELRRYRAA